MSFHSRGLRILLIGQASFAEKVLDGLVGNGEEVVAVFCPPDASQGKIDPLKRRALDLALPVFQPKNLKVPEVYDSIQGLHLDLGVLAYVTQIVPLRIINAPRLGSICFHPSLLPKYRGGSAINWALIKGEEKTGVTVFWPDEGIDTGPILLQKEVDISPEDTAGSLYYTKLFPLGVEAMLQAVNFIKTGSAPRLPQDEIQATYDPLCRDHHAKIDWSWPAQQVYNLIRGCDPQPGAHTVWQRKMLRLYDCRLDLEARGAPGEILGLGEEDFSVAAGDGGIRVRRVRVHESSEKVNAGEFARTLGLTRGSRLG